MTDNRSQRERILDFLAENACIDRIQAFYQLGIFELSARICELEKAGYEFRKERCTGKSTRGYRYSYIKYYLVRS